MNGPLSAHAAQVRPARPSASVVVLAAFWIAGILLSRLGVGAGWWLATAGAVACTAVAMAFRRRPAAARRWAVLMIVPVAAAWSVLQQFHVQPNHICQYVGASPSLVRVAGRIESRPLIRGTQSGAFAEYGWAAPATLAVMRVNSVVLHDRSLPCAGSVLLKISETDDRLRRGDRISAIGWLRHVEGPLNPGERDYRRVFGRRGIDARLTLISRANRRVLDAGGGWSVVRRARDRLSDVAAAALRTGMEDDQRRVSLLEMVLLGRRTAEYAEMSESFRRVGLAHMLSISGAHLAILLGLVWGLMRVLTGRPRIAASAVCVVLVLFLAVVPWRVPIVRAGIMAGLFALGYSSGRRVAAIQVLALATLVVLIWRSVDLFNPGFQLSFGTVAALILFTRRVSRWMLPNRLEPSVWSYGARLIADYFAVNLVAFVVVTPVVAYHFQIITPLAVLLSIVALPVVTAALGLGYVKLLAGLMLPSLGYLLARPLAWVTDIMLQLVEHASGWPGATIDLQCAPSLAWVVAVSAMVLALLTGRFARRPAALSAAMALCLIWLVAGAAPASPAGRLLLRPTVPPLRLNMLAVGNGSCFLLRIGEGRSNRIVGTPVAASGGGVIMFDCGSQQYWGISDHSIAPALQRAGVRRIDTLIISHADMDHFNGTLDLLDRVRVGRVLVAPYLLAEARDDPSSPTGYLVEKLRERGVPIESVIRGCSETRGAAELEVLWPPADLVRPERNDASIVLRVRVAGRRVLLCGDIQQDAMSRLLDSSTDLDADVCDLPHHGSFVAASTRFLQAVAPELALQSAGPERLRDDRWAEVLEQSAVTHLVTARDGMVEIVIDHTGRISHSRFRKKSRESVVSR